MSVMIDFRERTLNVMTPITEDGMDFIRHSLILMMAEFGDTDVDYEIHSPKAADVHVRTIGFDPLTFHIRYIGNVAEA